MRTIKLITRFYSGIFLANFLVTLSCVYLMWRYGAHANEVMGLLFWFKVITLVIFYSAAIYNNKKELYYYQNLGVSKLTLGVTTSVFDFLLWLTLIIIVY